MTKLINNNLTKYLKPLLILIIVLPLIIFVVTAKNNFSNLASNDLFIIYLITVVLTTPSLIAKGFFKTTFIGFTTVATFMYYPLSYIFLFIIAQIIHLDLIVMLRGFIVFTIIYWNFLIIFIILTHESAYLITVTKKLIYLTIPIAIYLVIFKLIRPNISIVALDYLQHQTVVNKILLGQNLCLTPNACSNLFLQQGYTSIYHTILGNLGSYWGGDLSKIFYYVDLVWPLLGAIVLYKLFRQRLTNRFLTYTAVVLSLLVFINGAYDFVFFIPQTLCFFFFLNLFTSHRLTLIKLIIGLVILLLTHFIMGSFLCVILIVKFLLDRYYLKYTEIDGISFIGVLSVVITTFIILANLAGFSIEKTLQSGEVNLVGASTNLIVPNNIYFVLSILGFGIIIFLISLSYYFFTPKKHLVLFFSVIYICLDLSLYFLSPTYANKFLLGIGVFSTLIIIAYISHVNLNKPLLYILMSLLVLSYGFNYIYNYKSYLTFYRQSTGNISVLTPEDLPLINYLNNHTQNCLVISDPYTQIIIASFAQVDTARAQYMEPKSRKALVDFFTNPNDNNYNALLGIDETKGYYHFCLLYTSRLEKTIVEKNDFWLSNIYSYQINNDYVLGDKSILNNYLKTKGLNIKYSDQHFVLYSGN